MIYSQAAAKRSAKIDSDDNDSDFRPPSASSVSDRPKRNARTAASKVAAGKYVIDSSSEEGNQTDNFSDSDFD